MTRISPKNPPSFPFGPAAGFWMLAFGLLVLLRLAVIWLSPLGLGGDEAQYWHWSTTPAWGYFSKPPLIAWIIALTTGLWGDTAFAVRMAVPFLHAIGAMALWYTAKILWPDQPALRNWSAGLYLLLPIVSLSSFLISTDAVLLPLAALALLGFFAWQQKPKSCLPALMFGGMLGLGFLAKYAILFLLPGFLLLVIVQPQTRKLFLGLQGGIAALTAILIAAPNILWNQRNSFATVSHTAANMNFDKQNPWQNLVPDLGQLAEFWLSQIWVAGPAGLVFLMLALWAALRSDRNSTGFSLAVLTLSPFIIISAQAMLSRANANWAVIAYIPGTLLMAEYLVRKNPLGWRLSVPALHVLIALILSVLLLQPDWLRQSRLAAAFAQLNGWQETSALVLAAYHAGQDGDPSRPYAGIITDTRISHYALSWHSRMRPKLSLRMWPRYKEPHSHRELMQPLQKEDQQIWLLVAQRERFVPRIQADFTHMQPLAEEHHLLNIHLDGGGKRTFMLYKVQGYQPLPRGAAYEQKYQYLDD